MELYLMANEKYPRLQDPLDCSRWVVGERYVHHL